MLHKSCLSLGAAAALVLMTSACQMKPTRGSESQTRQFSVVMDKATKPIEINGLVVVLDTRSAFDYGLNRVENSIHFPWFNLAEKEDTGELMRDPRKAVQRLALAGLNPATPVIVVGYGAAGKGEEGRLAWNLLYLGFQDVQVASFDLLRKAWSQQGTPPPQNVTPWAPAPRGDLVVSLKEFRQLARDPMGRRDKHVWLIDVRSEREYFNREPGAPLVPDVGALNVPWTEFFTAQGRPNSKIRARLEALGIKPDHRVILVSQRGVRSGAVAYALGALGYTHAQNFVSGWRAYE